MATYEQRLHLTFEADSIEEARSLATTIVDDAERAALESVPGDISITPEGDVKQVDA